MMIQRGVLYVVATPIGNLEDMTPRAIATLKKVSCIAAEDTRHSAKLLHYFQITTPLISYHDHNEREMVPILIARLENGEEIALISDAGTPLLNDPGFQLITTAIANAIPVIPIPGANAISCALSAAGLTCERFIFEGFLPAQTSARREYLASLRKELRTLVFYESPYRLSATLIDMADIFGGTRRAVIARELTKIHETFLRDTLDNLVALVQNDANQQRGEIVLLVAGALPDTELAQRESEAERIFALLKNELPASRAVALAAQITGVRKNLLYARLIKETNNTPALNMPD